MNQFHDLPRAVRHEVHQWVKSKAFTPYFRDLHVRPGGFAKDLFQSLLQPRQIGPLSTIKQARTFGLGTNSLRKRYLSLASNGHVVLARVWMANTCLGEEETRAAPALLIAGERGDEEDNLAVEEICHKLVLLDLQGPANNEEQKVTAMLENESYQAFRVRTLPLSFTDNRPIHLFDTMLHKSVLFDGDFRRTPSILCLVHPRSKPAILPIPIALVKPFLSHKTDPLPSGVSSVADTDDDITNAMNKARAQLSRFWTAFENKANGEYGFSLKVKVADEHGVEYFWTTDIERQPDGTIIGTINNDPGTVKLVKCGDRVEIPDDLISDWMFMRAGKMLGNHTLRALFKTMSAQDVNRFKQIMVDE